MISIRKIGRSRRVNSWRTYAVFGCVTGAGILAAPDAASSANLCVCQSDMISLKDRLQGLDLAKCDDEAKTIAADALNTLVRASDERKLCVSDNDGNLLPQPGSYYVWRNFTAAVLVRIAGTQQRSPDDHCPAVPSISQSDIDALSAVLLGCRYKRADGKPGPDYSGIISPFPYFQRPGERGLSIGFSMGNRASGDIAAAPTDMKDYLKDLDAEKRCEEKKDCGESDLQKPFSPSAGNQSQTSPAQDPGQNGGAAAKGAEGGQSGPDGSGTAASTGGEGDKGSSKSSARNQGSGDGPLPSSGPEWLGRVIRMIARYYGVDEILEHGLLAMMIVAPQVFDALAEMSSKLTDGLNSPDLDNAFKNLDDAMAIARAVTALQGASGQNLSKALAAANGAIKEMPPQMRAELTRQLGPKLEQIGKMVDVLKTIDAKAVADAIRDPSNLNGLKDQLVKRLKDRTIELAKREATKAIATALHTDLNPDTVNAIFSGDVRRAAELTSRDMLGRFGKELGLPDLTDIKEVLRPEGVEKLVRTKIQERVSHMVNDFERKLGIDQRAIALLKAGASDNPKEALIATSIAQLPPRFRSLAEAVRAGDVSKQSDALRDVAATELRARKIAPEVVDALVADKGFEAASQRFLMSELKKILPQINEKIPLTQVVGQISPLDAAQRAQLRNQFREQSPALVEFIRTGRGISQIAAIAAKRLTDAVPDAKEWRKAEQRQLVAAVRLALSGVTSDVDLTALLSADSLPDMAEIVTRKTRKEFGSFTERLRSAKAPPALLDALSALYEKRNPAPLRNFAAQALDKVRQTALDANSPARMLKNLQAVVSQSPAVLGESLSARLLGAATIEEARKVLDAAGRPRVQDLLNVAGASVPLSAGADAIDDVIQRLGSLNVWPDVNREFLRTLATTNLSEAVRQDARLREAVGDPAAFITAASRADVSGLTGLLYGNANQIMSLERHQLGRTLEIELTKALATLLPAADIDALAKGKIAELSGKLDDVATALHLRPEQLEELKKGNTVGAFAEFLEKAGHRPAVALDELMNASDPQAALGKLWAPLASELPVPQAAFLTSLLKPVSPGSTGPEGDAAQIPADLGKLRQQLALVGLEHLGPLLEDDELIKAGKRAEFAVRVLNRIFCADAVLQGQYCLWRTAARDQIDAMKAKLAQHVGATYASALLNGKADIIAENLSIDVANLVAGQAALSVPKSGAEALDSRLEALKGRSPDHEVPITALISPRESCVGGQFLRRSELLHRCLRSGRLTGAGATAGPGDAPRCETEAIPTNATLNAECGPS
jgi:hypothetical protein